MLAAFEAAWKEVATELTEGDAFFKEVWEDLAEYRSGYKQWSNAIYLPHQ